MISIFIFHSITSFVSKLTATRNTMLDILLILIYLIIVAALATTAWAVVRTMRIVGKTSGKSHGIPVRRINITVCAAVIIVMLLSFIIGSTDPMHINTQTYGNAFWLRMSNMFVFTSITAIVVAAVTMIYSTYKTGKDSGRTMIMDLAHDICHLGHKAHK